MLNVEYLKLFVNKIHRLGLSHDQITGIRGSTTKEQITLDLYKSASGLLGSANDSKQFLDFAEELEGKLTIAQAVGAIGSKDLDELLDDLKVIELQII